MSGTEFEDYEGGADEAAMTTLTTSYDLVDDPGTGSVVHDTAWSHGGITSARAQGNGAANYATWTHDLGADASAHARRIYIKIGSIPTTGTMVFIKFLNQANSLACQACMNITTGALKLQNSSSSAIGSPDSGHSAGEIIRLEMRVAAGVATLDAYYSSTNNLEGTTPDYTVNGAITQGSVGKVQLGAGAPGVAQMWFDDDAFNTSGAAVGPTATPPPTAGDLIIDRS